MIKVRKAIAEMSMVKRSCTVPVTELFLLGDENLDAGDEVLSEAEL